jgi:hypothetical protein
MDEYAMLLRLYIYSLQGDLMGSGLYLILGIITGGVSIGVFLGLYYKKSYQKLLEEVAKLRGLTLRMLETMEISGLIEWQRDSFGNINGLEVQSSPKESKKRSEDHKNRTIH